MDVFDLYGKIEIDLTTYQNNLRRAVEMARTAAGDIQTAMNNVGTSTQNANTQTVTYNTTLVNVASQSHNAERASKNFGDVLKDIGGKAMDAAKKVGSMMTDIAKGATAAVGVAGASLSGLTKQALGQVAEYEQLVGGVDTLFKDSSEKIQKYANEAYRTAGLSANEYMQTTINFSGSLIRALQGDTEKAAEMSNLAITDMADNVNKLGTSMEMVQNAYRGLSRQNFTMIDNLSLGYSGTAEGMAQLINDSGVLGGAMEATADNIKEIGFDKYIEAIHKIQELRGITGTTKDEAEKTISGSMASMKAAWKNFLTGVGDGKEFTEALSTAIGNVRNNLQKIIPRLSEGLTELIDQIAPEIPPIIEEMLPAIIDGSSSLIKGLAKRMPQLIKTVLPALTKGVADVVNATVSVLPQLVRSVSQTIPIVIEQIMRMKPALIRAGKDIVNALFPNGLETVTELTQKAVSMVTTFAQKITDPESLGIIFEKGFDIIGAIVDGLLSQESIDTIVEAAPKVIGGLASGITSFLFGRDKSEAGGLFGAVLKIAERIRDYLSDSKNVEKLNKAAIDTIENLGKFLVDNVGLLLKYTQQIGQALAEGIISAFLTDLRNLFGGVDEQSLMNEFLMSDTTESYTDFRQRRLREMGRESSHEIEERYPDYVPTPTYTWTNSSTNLSHLPAAARDQLYRATGRGYATGGIFNRPTYALIGEDGAEAVMPLEKNTGWIDRLAERLGGGGVVIQFGDIHVNGTENVGREVVAQIDSALRQYQIQQQRGVGGTGWV